MIRIMTADDPTYTTITVDGQLSGEYVETIETCCAQAVLKGKPVQLFLRDVQASTNLDAGSCTGSPVQVLA